MKIKKDYGEERERHSLEEVRREMDRHQIVRMTSKLTLYFTH